MENKQGKQKPYEARKQQGESLAKTSTESSVTAGVGTRDREGEWGKRVGGNGREMELEKNEK